MPETDGLVTLRERVRERLVSLIGQHVNQGDDYLLPNVEEAADAILREFRLQPVAWGRVDAETEEVAPLNWNAGRTWRTPPGEVEGL